jgi:hypothetical protein
VSKRCAHPNCKTIPNYGLEGKKASHCKTHAPVDYVNVKNKRCVHPNCKTIPNYGLEGKKASHCKTHAPVDYVNVKNKHCVHPNCKTRPNYGLEGKKASHCKTHAPVNYVNVNARQCVHPNCKKQPNYGLEGKKTTHCKTHAPVDYVNVNAKHCARPNCKTRPSYGRLFRLKTHCAKHKTPNMYINNRPKCGHEDCKERPFYGTTFPERCEGHKIDTDTNLVEKKCNGCEHDCFLTDGLCHICKYGTKPVKLRKELRLKQLLDANELTYESHDKIFAGSCHKYRPDFIFMTLTHVIILEVDENQHVNYKCDQARTVNLAQDFGGMPVVFIRYNPDVYTDHLGERIRSAQTKRVGRLIEVIKKCQMYKPTTLLSRIALFYDGDDGTNTIQPIDLSALGI